MSDYIDKIAPEHDRTSCSDQDLYNAAFGLDDHEGHGRCYRCTLLAAARATPADLPVAYEWRMKSEGDWLPLFPSDIAMMCAMLGHEARPATVDHISEEKVIEPERYVVQKASGSSTARVIDTHSGMTIKAYDIFKRNGWERADKHAATLNARLQKEQL